MRDDASLDEARSALEDAPATRSGDRWTGTLSGFMPVQGRGTVDGHKWYFRSRDGVWRFEVSDIAESELVIFILRDVDTHNGMMPFSVAWRIIEESIAKWRVGTLLRRMQYGGKKGRSAARRMKARSAEGRRGSGIYIVWASKSERRRNRGSRSKP